MNMHKLLFLLFPISALAQVNLGTAKKMDYILYP